MRLFIATNEFPEAFRESLEILNSLNVQNVLIRPQKENQIHLTLRFVGEIADEKLFKIEELVARVGAKHKKNQLLFNKWIALPDHGPVRIIALGSFYSAAEIQDIAKELDDGCEKWGALSEARKFIPHLTLARVRSDNSHGELRRRIHELPVPELKLSVNTLILYRSYLKPHGAEYEKVFWQSLH